MLRPVRFTSDSTTSVAHTERGHVPRGEQADDAPDHRRQPDRDRQLDRVDPEPAANRCGDTRRRTARGGAGSTLHTTNGSAPVASHSASTNARNPEPMARIRTGRTIGKLTERFEADDQRDDQPDRQERQREDHAEGHHDPGQRRPGRGPAGAGRSRPRCDRAAHAARAQAEVESNGIGRVGVRLEQVGRGGQRPECRRGPGRAAPAAPPRQQVERHDRPGAGQERQQRRRVQGGPIRTADRTLVSSPRAGGNPPATDGGM